MLSKYLLNSIKQQRVSHRYIRYLSTLLSQNPNAITLANLRERLDNSSTNKNDEHIIHLIKSINKSDNQSKQELINEIFKYVDNFAIYFKLKDLSLPTESLIRLIDINPGRVFQSWDLFKNNSLDLDDNELILKVIEKLLNGEKFEINEFVFNINNLSKTLYLINKVDEDKISEELIDILFARLVEINLISSIDLISIPNELSAKVISKNSQLDDYSFLKIFNNIFYTSPELLSKELLVQSLDKIEQLKNQDIDELNHKQSKLFNELINESCLTGLRANFNSIDITQIYNDVLSHIESNQLDSDKSPESLLIRLKLIEIYGINENNIEKTLHKFHHYQTHDRFGIDLIQAKLVQAFCYQSINQNDANYLKVAQTLLPVNLPIKTLQCLILSNSNFNVEHSLDLYNDYIMHVSKKLNEFTKRSPSGLITEALILSYLFNHDREFAYLIFDKSIENKIMADELEIATVKKLFKVYGDAFIEDDSDKAKLYLKDYILKYIKGL